MKSFILILLYIGQAILFYLIFCCIGLIWADWDTVVHGMWNMPYWFFVGWWLPIPATMEFDDKYKC